MEWRRCCRRSGCPEVLVVDGDDANGEDTIIHIKDDFGDVIRLTPLQFLEVYAAIYAELNRMKRHAP